jgi:hypothetical protein
MAATYDEQGDYVYPEGFDPDTGEWLEGYEEQRAAWEEQYATARARWEAHCAAHEIEVQKEPALPEPTTGIWPRSEAGVPLLEWRGMKHMTRTPTVAAKCRTCGNEWLIESRVTNTLAQELGLGGRLSRRGTRMEQFGATFTLGASGRRIAAGNEAARQEEQLARLIAMHACRLCRSIDVVLAHA